MPVGLIIMKWDERIGAEVLGKYPEEVILQEKTLMQLYSQHEFTGEAGFVTLMAGSISIASYYTGPEMGIYIILMLTIDESGELYEEGLAEIARQAVMERGQMLELILPQMFQRLALYPTLNGEQRSAMLLQNDVKRLVLSRLREEVFFPKSELSIWLKDQYKNSFVDIESLVNELVRMGIVKITSVKGYASDLLCFTGDLIALRVPPIELVKDPVKHHLPETLVKSYKEGVTNFFKQYQPEQKDSLKIISEIILDPSNYEVLKLLRVAIVTRNDLEKLRKKGVDDVDSALKTFHENKMLDFYRDDIGTEYFCLTNDFVIESIFPRYALDVLREQYQNKVQNPQAILKIVDIIKEEYINSIKIVKEVKPAQQNGKVKVVELE